MDRTDNEIIFRSLTGKISPEEEKYIAELYQKQPEECRSIFKDMHAIYDLNELEAVDRKFRKQRTAALWGKTIRTLAGSAAAIAIAAATGYASHLLTVKSFSEMMATVEAPHGERVKIVLPDSTSVHLNSGARLQYPVVFSKDRRSVSLSGEAMFEVSHNENHPFVVNTFASEIEVLGTKFNVSADEADGTFSTALLEGKVRLTNLLDGKRSKITMLPNDIIRITDGKFELTHSEDPDICWTRGLIKIDGKTFPDLMDEFEKAFGIKIIISSNSLPDMNGAGGKIRVSDGIDNAMKILQHTTHFNFRRDDATNTITIF